MTFYSIVLAVHIAFGTICLAAGALAAAARKRRGKHTWVGEVYHFGYVFVFLTAILMSIMKWSELAYLFYIALFSYGLALYGYLAGKLRWRNWVPQHISGMLGSYIGVITAVLVVNAETVTMGTGMPSILLWFLPTIIGSPLIALTTSRFLRPRRRL